MVDLFDAREREAFRHFGAGDRRALGDAAIAGRGPSRKGVDI
jgi:hypothetical protein